MPFASVVLFTTRARVKQIYRVTWGFTCFYESPDFGESGGQF